ncbi:MAG: hypothetical protein JSR82_18465 [Verrucomicrobia bacterium]|nr:hypothetical protein [Verrucomicrobiota bacterium]
MPPPPLDPSLPAGQRALRAFGGAALLLCAAGAAWGLVQFIAAVVATGRNLQELLGYQALVTSPAAALAGGLAGAVLGWMAPRGRLRWRLTGALVIFAVLGAVWAGYLAFTAK